MSTNVGKIISDYSSELLSKTSEDVREVLERQLETLSSLKELHLATAAVGRSLQGIPFRTSSPRSLRVHHHQSSDPLERCRISMKIRRLLSLVLLKSKIDPYGTKSRCGKIRVSSTGCPILSMKASTMLSVQVEWRGPVNGCCVILSSRNGSMTMPLAQSFGATAFKAVESLS